MKTAKVGRLALRIEGEFWNAYYAMPETMDDAVLLGSIRMTIAMDPRRKAQFMALASEVVADLVEEATGTRPRMITERAPEHERRG